MDDASYEKSNRKMRSKYKKETGQNPDAKGKTKILGRVNKRMST